MNELISQQKTDLPPPSFGDWLFVGSWFIVGGLILWVVTVKTRGFEKMNAGLPQFLRGPDWEEKKWPYLAAPAIITTVGVIMAVAAFATG